MAQFGRALRSGRRGRRFESCHLDHIAKEPHYYAVLLLLSPKNPRKTVKKLIRGDLVEDSDGAFLLPGVKVTVGIPCHLHVRVAKPARNLLNVYPLVDE